jgi:hypothetical protein
VRAVGRATRRGATRRGATRRRAAARLGALGLLLVVVPSGCGADGPRGVQVPELVDHDRDPTRGIRSVDPDRTDVLPAADLRLAVEEILGEHTWLAIDSSLAAADGSADVDAVLAAVTENTTSLTTAIGVVYGPVGAGAVDELWVMHTQFFLDWAVARAAGDETGTAQAERRLRDYEADFASLLDTATGGQVPAEAAEQLLAEHVRQVLAVLDARIADRADTVAPTHEAYAYARVVGSALAGGFHAQQPEAFPGDLDDPATEARSALAADLGEWALLCADIGAPGAAGRTVPDGLVTARATRADTIVARLGQASPATWQRLDAVLAEHATAVAAGVPAPDDALGAAAAALAADLAATTGVPTTQLAAPVYDLVAALAAVAESTASGDPATALAHRSDAYAAARDLADLVAPAEG